MKRRNFLKHLGTLGIAPMFLNGIPIRAFANTMLPSTCDIEDRVTIIIHLKGGNDGINTVIPIHQYDTYANIRPNIKINDTGTNGFINLDNTLPLEKQVGLNPALSAFKNLYDSGKMSLVQAVSYNSPNKSHFKATDLWMTGGDGDANSQLQDGWMARYLNNRFPDFNGSPTITMLDPLGIQLGDAKPSVGFHTSEEHNVEINLSGQDPAGFYSLITGIGGLPLASVPNSEYGEELQHIMNIENTASVFAQRISSVFNSGSNSETVSYPDNKIADQLRTVARLLSGGSQTKIFLLNQSGYDTHVNQVEEADTSLGKQAVLLEELATALQAFQNDLQALGIEDRVMTATMSEFGRKATENGNFGTDHGTMGPMFIIGKHVEAGVLGNSIDLTNLDNNGAPHPNQIQHDYRQVFATLIQDWMGGNDAALQATYFETWAGSQKLPLVNSNQIADANCYIGTPPPPEEAITAVQACMILEGYFDDAENCMCTTLNENSILPTNQPFNDDIFAYNGTESIDAFPFYIVDWVLVEVRDANDASIVLARKAALLARNGCIRDIDLTETLKFNGLADGNYHLAVFHRNHLPIISSEPIAFNFEEPPIWDFTTAETQAMGTQQLKGVGNPTKYALHGGDFDQNGTIDDTDFNDIWKPNRAKLNTYHIADTDGNGIINNLDANLWKRNKNKTALPILHN